MSKSDPGAIVAMDSRNKILNLAIQGLTVQGIMEATGYSDETVRNTLSDIRADLSLRLQEAQESWIAMNLARTEKIISKVMPVFDRAAPDFNDQTADGETKIKSYTGLIGDAAKIFLNVAKLQKDMLQLKIEAPAGSNANIVNHNTFIADSEFYKEALEHVQRERTGQTWEEYQEAAADYVDVIPTLDENDNLHKVEAKLDRLLLPPVPPNDDETDE